MDGHRAGAKSVNKDNVRQALGYFEDSTYVSPKGERLCTGSAIAKAAKVMIGVQDSLASLKVVIGHSDSMLLNLRTEPDLPLGNLVADALRSYASGYFKMPMDFAVINFGGIRVPMPKGEITIEDISSMFPFKNYICHVRMKGSELTSLLDTLAASKAFQAVSGATVRVKDHKVESALIGGKPINPSRIYNLATIDFLLDGGDRINIGALAQKVTLSTVLVKDVMLSYVRSCEAEGKMVSGRADGRVIME